MEKRAETKSKVIDFSTTYSEHLKGLSSAKTPDLEIHIKNEILKVHKIILASGNEVFKAMLDSQMSESKNNRLEISDCDPAAFKVFLAHLYSSQLSSGDISLDLLMIAEKYLDLPLTTRCIEKLSAEIDQDNLVETVQVATKFNFKELMSACQKFVTENLEKLIDTPQMNAILKNKAFVVGVFKEYDARLVKSKIHKFILGGFDVLFAAKCDYCMAPPTDCDCKFSKYKYASVKPEVPSVTFFADDIEWSVSLATRDADDETVGIDLYAVGKNVHADVRITVISENPEFSNITIEKKNRMYGHRFFKVLESEEYLNDRAYTTHGGLSIELSIKVLSVECKKKSQIN